MFILILALLLVLVSGICWIRYAIKKGRREYTDSDGWAISLDITAGMILIASFVITGVQWANQISDIEDLRKFDNLEKIYQQKAEVLTNQFTKYLAETYPQHEKGIFGKISPEKVDIYLVKYPELQASKTIIALTEKINQLQADRYAQQVNKEQSLKNIRFRLRNPWIWYWAIPEK